MKVPQLAHMADAELTALRLARLGAHEGVTAIFGFHGFSFPRYNRNTSSGGEVKP
jgi:hypothetical protein